MSRGHPAYLTKEAKEDGVYLVDGYLAIPCEICGGKVFRGEYSRKRQYICEQCKEKIKALTKVDVVALTTPQDTLDKYEKRFRTAVDNIKQQAQDVEVYRKAVNAASTRMDRYGSVPEAMAAIELLKNKLRIIPQQKVGKHKVDFCIPDLKVVVEIDGSIYHQDMGKEVRKNADIKYCLGQDWTVIHVPAEDVRKDVTCVMEQLRWRIKDIPSTT